MIGRARRGRVRSRALEVPRGSVAVLSACLLGLPAGLALGHDANISAGNWVHHHTATYTYCNALSDTHLHDRAAEAVTNWDNALFIDFPKRSDCHPSSGSAVHLQLQDGHYGNTGWRASSLSNPDSSHNAGYHAHHTHLQFNLDANWNQYVPYDKRAVACRAIGHIIGVAKVPATEHAAHGRANDCLSLDGSPSNQVSAQENPQDYTYTDSPGQHSIDLLDQAYLDDAPDIHLTGDLSDGDFASPLQLAAGSFDLTFSAEPDPGVGPGVERLTVLFDDEEVASETQVCPSDGCDLAVDWTLDTVGLTAGEYTLSVVAEDSGGPGDQRGLSDQRDYTFEIPEALGSPPTLELTGGLVDSLDEVLAGNSAYPLHVVAQDPDPGPTGAEQSGLASVDVMLDDEVVHHVEQGCPAGGCSLVTDWSLNPAQLGVGEHEVVVTATDHFGHDSSAFLTVSVAEPGTTLVAAPPALATPDESTFEFESSISGATFECRRDSQAWAPCSSPKSYGGIADGDHLFLVRAVAPVGGAADSTPSTVDWTVDSDLSGGEAISDQQGTLGKSPDPESLAAHTEAMEAIETGPASVDLTAQRGGSPLTGANPQELDWCLPGHPVKCAHYFNEAQLARRAGGYLYRPGGFKTNDNTIQNSFQHAFWTALMVNYDPGNRKHAIHFSRLHEAGRPHSSDNSTRRSSRADTVNNHVGYHFATVRRARNHNKEFFCHRLDVKNVRHGQHIPFKTNPWRWSGAPYYTVFRALRNDEDHLVTPVYGHTCAFVDGP